MKAFLCNLFKKTLLCLWFLCVAFPILLFLERPPVSIYQDRYIEPKKVYPGDEITINIKASMTKDCPAEVLRVITDSTGRQFPYEIDERPKRESYPVKKIVPIGVYPGPAEYQATIYWQCNWVQRLFLSIGRPAWYPFIVKPPNISFEVLPTPEQLPMLEKQGKIYIEPTPSTAFMELSE